jgi:hypothetical protein
MTRKTFNKDVSVELIIEGNSVEIVATVQFTTTPYDPGISIGPAEKCYPPEGGEIEDVEITALVLPEISHGREHQSRPEIKLECPAWLAEAILANVNDNTLIEAVDWDED